MLVVLDTNVLVSGLRSRNGASFRLLSLVDSGAYNFALSVPLVLEYEDALTRDTSKTLLSQTDIADFLDFLCLAGTQQPIFYLWRPLLRDPKDDHVAELAVAAGCDAIVTFNLKDFKPISRFGIQLFTPGEFLRKLKVPR